MCLGLIFGNLRSSARGKTNPAVRFRHIPSLEDWLFEEFEANGAFSFPQSDRFARLFADAPTEEALETAIATMLSECHPSKPFQDAVIYGDHSVLLQSSVPFGLI
jgi:hypothetical protein